jgi:hypothetical protein
MVKLKHRKEISDLVSLVVLTLKEEYKNLDINDLKTDYELIICVAKLIEKKISKDKCVSKSTARRIDKADLLRCVFQALYEDLTESDLSHINKGLEFCIDQKIIGQDSLFLKLYRLFLRLL